MRRRCLFTHLQASLCELGLRHPIISPRPRLPVGSLQPESLPDSAVKWNTCVQIAVLMWQSLKVRQATAADKDKSTRFHKELFYKGTFTFWCLNTLFWVSLLYTKPWHGRLHLSSSDKLKKKKRQNRIGERRSRKGDQGSRVPLVGTGSKNSDRVSGKQDEDVCGDTMESTLQRWNSLKIFVAPRGSRSERSDQV